MKFNRIILGSQSPRRRELMAGLDRPFEAVSIDADESFDRQLKGGDIPLYISRAKAHAYTRELEAGEMLITSDTIVWIDEQMLGKPKDDKDACRMLRLLSGHTHQVYTAVTFTYIDQEGRLNEKSLVDKADVTFRELSDEEINYYVQHYHPLDKAGAYGVQEWIGYIGVEKIYGSYFTIMGFPIERVYQTIRDLEADEI